MKKLYQHFDLLNKELAIGDCVAFNSFYKHGLSLGTIVELKRTRATVKTITLNEPHRRDNYFVDYEEDITSRDLIKLDSKEVAFQVLQRS